MQLGRHLLLLQALESDVHEWVPVLLPTDWVGDTGQTAFTVSFCLCQAGKCTLLGRAVTEIKHSHAYSNTVSSLEKFEEGLRILKGLQKEVDLSRLMLTQGFVLGLAITVMGGREKMQAVV